MNKESNILTLTALPKELFYRFNVLGSFTLKCGAVSIPVDRIRTKSNVAEINGWLYYFGNTYGSINPYKKVKSLDQLSEFIYYVSSLFDMLTAKVDCDVSYVNVSTILSNEKLAQKLLTVEDTVYPDYLVESPNNTTIKIEIDEKNKIVEVLTETQVNKVGFFDLNDLFNAEYLNSLHIVKMKHSHQLDIHGVINLIRQMNERKMIDIVDIFDSNDNITIALHIQEKMIAKAFAYKLRDRIAKVDLLDLTEFFVRSSIKN